MSDTGYKARKMSVRPPTTREGRQQGIRVRRCMCLILTRMHIADGPSGPLNRATPRLDEVPQLGEWVALKRGEEELEQGGDGEEHSASPEQDATDPDLQAPLRASVDVEQQRYDGELAKGNACSTGIDCEVTPLQDEKELRDGEVAFVTTQAFGDGFGKEDASQNTSDERENDPDEIPAPFVVSPAGGIGPKSDHYGGNDDIDPDCVDDGGPDATDVVLARHIAGEGCSGWHNERRCSRERQDGQ